MADNRVVIRIDVKADTADIERVRAQLALLNRESRDLRTNFDKLANVEQKLNKQTQALAVNAGGSGRQFEMAEAHLSRFGRSARGFDRNADVFTRAMRRMNTAVGNFVKFTLKALIVELGVLAVGLASVNGLFALGRWTVKVYHSAMAVLAGGVASVGVALATAAAAQRQWNAAVFAYNQKGAPALNTGLNQSMQALRSLTTDVDLAVFGMQQLNETYVAMARHGSVTAPMVRALREAGNFAAAGGDLTAAGEFIALLQKEGRLTTELIEKSTEVSESFSSAIEAAQRSGLTTAEQIFRELRSGRLAREAGLEGQLSVINNTLVGQFKSYFTLITQSFADLGQRFLPEMQMALQDIFKIIQKTNWELGIALERFGSGTFVEGLVSGFEKLADLSIKLFERYLPKVDGMAGRIAETFQRWGDTFASIRDTLDPLREGGSVIIDTLGPVFREIFNQIGKWFTDFNVLLVENREDFENFGNSLKSLMTAIGEFFSMMKRAFVEALPWITRVVDALTGMLEVLTLIGGALTTAFGSHGAFAQFALTMGMALGLKGGRGHAFVGGLAGRMALRGAAGQQGGGAATGAASSAASMVGAAGLGGYWPMPWAVPGQGSAPGTTAARSRWARFKPGQYFTNPRAAGSVGMGSALGLASILPITSEEARGPLGLGAILAATSANPYLGGAVAGTGIALNSRTIGGGILGGAIAGTSAGAMIGSIVPVIGTGVGAVAGGLIGGIGGGILGYFNQKKENRNRAAAYGLDTAGMVTGNVTDLLSQGQAREAQDLIHELVFGLPGKSGRGMSTRGREQELLERLGLWNADAISGYEENSEAYLIALGEQVDLLNEATKGPIRHFNTMMDELTNMTGKSENELMDLANTMGVNLYDETMSLADAMRDLGLSMPTAREEIIRLFRDVQLAAAQKYFGDELDAMDAQQAVDQKAEELRQLGPDATRRDFLEFMEILTVHANNLFPENPIDALNFIQSNLGTADGVMGSQWMTEGGPLQGLWETFVSSGAQADLANFLTGSLSPEMLTQLFQSQLAEQGYEANYDEVLARFESIGNLDVLASIFDQLAAGVAVTEGPDHLVDQGPIIDGFDVSISKLGDAGETISSEAEGLQNEIMAGIAAGFEPKPGWWEQMPVWWDTPPALVQPGQAEGPSSPNVPQRFRPTNTGLDDGSGDTMTSRLSRLTARHMSISSRIAGNQSISSMWRDTNLGSSNSDHLTGNAYDLVGQNLGAYQRAVTATGGFAEFHGVGANRHLHVVPGDGPAAMGDTVTPFAKPVKRRKSSGSATYNVTVNAGSNASPEAIAQAVLRSIRRAERSAAERM